MINNLFEAKSSTATHRVLATTPNKNQPALAALRFGSNDSASVTSAIPEWAKKIKDPQLTWPDLLKDGATLTSPIKTMRNFTKFIKDFSADHDKYLPLQAQKDLKRYHWTPGYWMTYIFKPQQARLMNVVYRGPLAIKLKQEEVSNLPALKVLAKLFKAETKNFKWYQKLAIKIPIFLLDRKIKKTEGYTPLLNRVPPLPYEKFEKQLQKLQQQYNSKNSHNPIESIEKKPIGTGSIGQVYKATTKNGQTVVLKVIKPEITPQYLNEYLPLLYYKAMLMLGKKPQDKIKAVAAAEQSIHILKDEIQPEKEAKNTKLMQYWAKQLDCKEFQIPDVLASTESGIITPFVGEKDVADLKDSEKVDLKIKLAPDLAKLLVLSPVKPLDLHEGNMRTGTFWIDHGRQINLNKAAHKTLMKLMISVLKSPQQVAGQTVWDNALLQPDTRAHLKELLLFNPALNKAMLNNLEKLEHEIQEKQKNSASTTSTIDYSDQIKQADFIDLKIQLSKLLGQPPTITQQQKQSSNHLSSEFSEPSILNAWASCALNLPGFAEVQLPHHDVNQYKRKSSGFLIPYVQDIEAKSSSGSKTSGLLRKPKLTDKQKSQFHNLASILTNGLLEQTDFMQITPAEHKQLVKNIQHGLQKDLLPNYVD